MCECVYVLLLFNAKCQVFSEDPYPCVCGGIAEADEDNSDFKLDALCQRDIQYARCKTYFAIQRKFTFTFAFKFSSVPKRKQHRVK